MCKAARGNNGNCIERVARIRVSCHGTPSLLCIMMRHSNNGSFEDVGTSGLDGGQCKVVARWSPAIVVRTLRPRLMRVLCGQLSDNVIPRGLMGLFRGSSAQPCKVYSLTLHFTEAGKLGECRKAVFLSWAPPHIIPNPQPNTIRIIYRTKSTIYLGNMTHLFMIVLPYQTCITCYIPFCTPKLGSH